MIAKAKTSFSSFHRRFGTAGVVISVIALVFALAGGAFAATGGLTAKQKKQVKAIAKSYQGTGPAGAAGAQGANGLAGTNGTNGPKGDTGDPGTSGKTVLSGTTVPSAGLGTDGDFYIRTTTSEIYGPKTAGAWGSPTSLKGADGVDGSPWTAGGVLPSGSTETGTWVTPAAPFGSAGLMDTGTTAVPVSFPVPVDPAPTLEVVPPDGDTGAPGASTNCAGLSASGVPQADSGFLCVYTIVAFFPPPAISTSNPNTPAGGSGTDVEPDGTLLQLDCASGPCAAKGPWAVTG